MFLTLIAQVTPPPLFQTAPQTQSLPSVADPIEPRPIATGPSVDFARPRTRHGVTIGPGPVTIDFTSLPIHMYGYAVFHEYNVKGGTYCWFPIRYSIDEALADRKRFENTGLNCNPNKVTNGFISFTLYDRRLGKRICKSCYKNRDLPRPQLIKDKDDVQDLLQISVKNGIKWAEAPRRRPTWPTRTFGQQAF